MTAEPDFERTWQAKLARGLEQVADAETRRHVMRGHDALSSASTTAEVIEWSRQAMERLTERLDPTSCREVMTGCACHYPVSELRDLRALYAETRDLDRVHRLLQSRFESFLGGGEVCRITIHLAAAS